jgi:hypothetical protein
MVCTGIGQQLERDLNSYSAAMIFDDQYQIQLEIVQEAAAGLQQVLVQILRDSCR